MLRAPGIALLSQQVVLPDSYVDTLVQTRVAEAIGNIGQSQPGYILWLEAHLHWPYWEVRMVAARAQGKIRRHMPEAVINRLTVLLNDPESSAVRDAAEDALGEILALDENVIEDDAPPA